MAVLEKRKIPMKPDASTRSFDPRYPSYKRDSTITSGSVHQNLSMCDLYITPLCITALYNISNQTRGPGDARGSIGIYEEYLAYSQPDLDLFLGDYTDIPNGTHPTIDKIDGGVANISMAWLEGNLDFQMTYPIVYPQEVVLYQLGDPFLYHETIITGNGYALTNVFLDAIDGVSGIG